MYEINNSSKRDKKKNYKQLKSQAEKWSILFYMRQYWCFILAP